MNLILKLVDMYAYAENEVLGPAIKNYRQLEQRHRQKHRQTNTLTDRQSDRHD